MGHKRKWNHHYTLFFPTGVAHRDKKVKTTYRYKNVQKILQSRQLRDELLDDFAEGLEYGVVVNAGQVEAEEEGKWERETLESYSDRKRVGVKAESQISIVAS